jgi:RNA polymerase sigma factor (sigma-70 family)
MPDSDANLISASLEDAERFGELFDRHFVYVHRFCARRIDATRSEDIAGEVFRRAFEARDRYDLNRPDARPWLLAIALNLVRDAHRATLHQHGAYQRELSLHRSRPRALDDEVIAVLDTRRDLAAVAAALELLPVGEVETLLLHVWEELSYEEVALVLDIPIGTVRSRLHRIRERLHELLGEEDPVPSRSEGPRGGSHE